MRQIPGYPTCPPISVTGPPIKNFQPEPRSPWVPSVLNGQPQLQGQVRSQQALMTCVCLMEGCFLHSADRIYMPSVPNVLI